MIPWRREQLPMPVFWPGEFHGLYSPWGRKESDTTERLSPGFKSPLHIVYPWFYISTVHCVSLTFCIFTVYCIFGLLECVVV